jgi:hypothetical protein
MTSPDRYHAKAADLTALARLETNPRLRREFAHLALAYRRLAVQADNNSRNDIVFEMPPQAQPAQQPQSQLTKKTDE